jgi:hypothetical protein
MTTMLLGLIVGAAIGAAVTYFLTNSGLDRFSDNKSLVEELEADDRPVAIDEIDARDATGQKLTH